MNLKIVMVEGPHDSAFISRIMQLNGYKTCKKPIGEYHPEFVSKYLSGQYKKAPVDQLNLQSVRQEILFPSYSLVSGSEMILIFQMGGDSRADRRKKLIGDVYGFLKSSMTANAVSNDESVTFIYEFDADEEDVAVRLAQVNEEIREVDSTFPGLETNGSYVLSNGIRWGAYIFADQSGKGRLEDIILPMMEQGNEDIAGIAKDFVDKRDSFSLFQKEKSTKHPLKAQVGVMGQLQKAGSANPAIIEQSSYLSAEKILNSPVCIAIFKFLAG